MVLNTLTVGAAVTPAVVKTYTSHVSENGSIGGKQLRKQSFSTYIESLVAKNLRPTYPTMKVLI